MISIIARFITIVSPDARIRTITLPPSGGKVGTSDGYPLVFHEGHLKIAKQWERLDSGLAEVFEWEAFRHIDPVRLTLVENLKGEV